jgi:HlyD family secretion protein
MLIQYIVRLQNYYCNRNIYFRMKKKKNIYILLSVVVILLIVALVKSKSGKDALKVTVEKCEKRTITETVSANGKVQPEVEVKISPDVSGEIVELYIKEGDKVKKGDLLVIINPDIYISARDRMEAALNTSKANLANALARLAQSKAQFINADATFKRNEQLFKQGAISPSEYDAAKSSYEVAKAEVEAAEQSSIASEFNVKSASASLKEAEDNLLRTKITAPVDGTVSMLNVEKGERVVGTSQMAGTEMMRIANLSSMEVKVEVNENDIVRVKLNDTADVEVDAYLGRKFQGVVTEISNSANTLGVSADQVTTFNVKIRILSTSYSDLQNETNKNLSPFRPGMSATVEVKTNKAENVLTIPIQAVTTREDTSKTRNEDISEDVKNQKEKDNKKKDINECVFVFKDGVAELRYVKTGIQDSKYIEVLSGISEEELVISGPYAAVSRDLSNDDKVEKKEKEELYKRSAAK